MHPLDFLSESPKFFIFQKETNKTNFGGVLFLIYLIIIISITIYYYIEYINTDEYQVQYKLLLNQNKKKEIDRINKKKKKNQNIAFSYYISQVSPVNNEIDLNRIKLYDYENEELFNESLTSQVNKTDILVLYECHDKKCRLDNSSELEFIFEVIYEGFKIDHQNETSPFNKEMKFRIGEKFFFDNITVIPSNWHNIIYKEKKGLFKENIQEIHGYIDSYYSYTVLTKYKTIKDKRYRILAAFFINNLHIKETEYERTEKSLLDYIANVFSFYSNVFFIAKIIFRFYSQNFDNYKIMEKIIQKNYYNIKNDKNIIFELSRNNNSINDYDKILNIDNNLKPNSLINNNYFNEKKIFINENNYYEDNDYEDNEDNDYDDNATKKGIKKFRFIHYFLNNLYCKCCKCCSKFKSQEIIHKCNEIILKYASIDYILYNQILLENLFKDYRWNNPELNNIDSNELIFKLKTLI